MTPFDPDERLLTRQEAAAFARMSVATIDRARYRGDLEEVGSPGLVFITFGALNRWLEKRRQDRDGHDDGRDGG